MTKKCTWKKGEKKEMWVNISFPGNKPNPKGRLAFLKEGLHHVVVEELFEEVPKESMYPDLDELQGEFPWYHLTIKERKEKQEACEHISWYKCNQDNDSDYWLSWSSRLMSNQLWLKCFDCGLLVQFLFDNPTIHYQE